jgi:hypothetical protein
VPSPPTTEIGDTEERCDNRQVKRDFFSCPEFDVPKVLDRFFKHFFKFSHLLPRKPRKPATRLSAETSPSDPARTGEPADAKVDPGGRATQLTLQGPATERVVARRVDLYDTSDVTLSMARSRSPER